MTKSNDQKIVEYKKNKIKKIVFISLYLLVIVLEILALFRIIDFIWGLIIFIPIYLFKKNF